MLVSYTRGKGGGVGWAEAAKEYYDEMTLSIKKQFA